MTTADHMLTIPCTEGGGACPACQSLVVPRMNLTDYTLYECEHCGCWSSDAFFRGAQTSFVPENYFAQSALEYPRWQVLSQRLANATPAIRSVLDVGCGTGAYLDYMRRHLGSTAQLDGIEVDPVRADQSRKLGQGFRIHEGDALAQATDLDQEFDLITLWDVFEHVQRPSELLEALSQTLSANGVIYLQTIHEHSLLPRLGRAAYRLSGGHLRYPAIRTHEAHHLVFFSRLGIELMAEKAGLEARAVWFDRLTRKRMDGPAIVTAAASGLLSMENAWGNGLFINVILERKRSQT